MQNNYLIAGSTAMYHWLPGLGQPKDLDVFYIEGTEKPKLTSANRIEFHTLPKDVFDKFITVDNYITLQSLYVLKLSHAEYDIHWHKTMSHLALLKKHVVPYDKMSEEYKELFNVLKAHWKNVVHKDKKSKITFDVSKEKFFNSNVRRIYDHDFLHDVVRYFDKPLYTRCLKEGKEVLFDKNKFDRLTFEEKISLCREEIYVLALERFMIPEDFKLDAVKVYKIAAKRLITRMSKGWFPTFMVEHWEQLKTPDKDYVALFKEKVK